MGSVVAAVGGAGPFGRRLFARRTLRVLGLT
jgi:hypothetical protein